MKERDKTNKLVSDDWFEGHDVFWISPDNQRSVLLNPGRDVVWFKKSYPVKGEVALTHKEYIRDLPQKLKGRIVGVSATSQNGHLKSKPVGTFFELFESNQGWRVWTSPREYYELNGKNRTKNRQVQKPSCPNCRCSSGSKEEGYGGQKNEHTCQNHTTTGT